MDVLRFYKDSQIRTEQNLSIYSYLINSLHPIFHGEQNTKFLLYGLQERKFVIVKDHIDEWFPKRQIQRERSFFCALQLLQKETVGILVKAKTRKKLGITSTACV